MESVGPKKSGRILEERWRGGGEQETAETVEAPVSKLCCAEKRPMWQRCVHALIHRDESVSPA